MSIQPVSAFSPLAWLGRSAIGYTSGLGRLGIFLGYGLFSIFKPPFNFRRFLDQVYFIGPKSMFVVSLTGLFTGMVLGIQGYYALSQVGSETVLGAGVALSLIRELGPVLTALMVTGRAGSSIAAELGIMRISEQIDALETMDINPMRFLIGPRFAAAIVTFPLLVAIVDVVGIIGGYLTGVVLLGINSGTYISHMEHFIVLRDVTDGFIKTFVFSIIVALICCFKGFNAHTRSGSFGAKGVSYATTSAVVNTSITILLADYVLTSLLMR